MTALLRLADLHVQFGGNRALDGANVEIAEGHIHGLIGPNGAGKTTALNAITGVFTLARGRIDFDGVPLRTTPRLMAATGIARTFQTPAVCAELSAVENAMLGGYSRGSCGMFSGALRTARSVHEERELRGQAEDILTRLEFPFSLDADAALLPLGGQRLVELARALMSHPRLLLLDEPASGMDRETLDILKKILVNVRKQSSGRLTVLLVEHNVPFVFSICDRVSVLDRGRDIAHGEPGDVRTNPVVIEAYLGQKVHEDKGVPMRRVPKIPPVAALIGVSPPARPADMTALALASMSAGYGKAVVIRGVSLSVRQGEAVGIVGRNGAGKSTLLKAVVGLLPKLQGDVTAHGKEITRCSTTEIIRAGIGYVPQGGGIFPSQTVDDNLILSALHLGLSARALRAAMKEVFDRFPRLASKKAQYAASLSGGERQMLTIGRALIQSPRLLLLDEPTIGLAPLIIVELRDLILNLQGEGLSMLITEQNVRWLSQVTERAYVIDLGEIVGERGAEELLVDDSFADQYLG